MSVSMTPLPSAPRHRWNTSLARHHWALSGKGRRPSRERDSLASLISRSVLRRPSGCEVSQWRCKSPAVTSSVAAFCSTIRNVPVCSPERQWPSRFHQPSPGNAWRDRPLPCRTPVRPVSTSKLHRPSLPRWPAPLSATGRQRPLCIRGTYLIYEAQSVRLARHRAPMTPSRPLLHRNGLFMDLRWQWPR
jgi:hypothetical protein